MDALTIEDGCDILTKITEAVMAHAHINGTLYDWAELVEKF